LCGIVKPRGTPLEAKDFVEYRKCLRSSIQTVIPPCRSRRNNLREQTGFFAGMTPSQRIRYRAFIIIRTMCSPSPLFPTCR
jgi:hypothetical protein